MRIANSSFALRAGVVIGLAGGAHGFHESWTALDQINQIERAVDAKLGGNTDYMRLVRKQSILPESDSVNRDSIHVEMNRLRLEMLGAQRSHQIKEIARKRAHKVEYTSLPLLAVGTLMALLSVASNIRSERKSNRASG